MSLAPTKKNHTFSIRRDTLEKLDALAWLLDRSKSELVEEAVTIFMGKQGEDALQIRHDVTRQIGA